MRGRNIFKLFSTSPLEIQNRNLSTALETFVWLPAIKKQDESTGLIKSRVVLSASEAKRRFALRERNCLIDPWGHAAARISVNFSAANANDELKEKIQELAIINNAVNLKNSKKINSFQAYFSLYPDFNNPRGGGFSGADQLEWDQGVNTHDPKINQGKARGLYLFNKKYAAVNNTHAADILGYGKPDHHQVFSRGLNFVKIVEKCFEMMVPVFRDNTIVMETISPSAVYYGKAMLDEHRLITKMLGNMIQEIPESEKENELFHVCTTANLILFKTGLGEDKYYEIVKKVFKEAPDLSHGFPITEFTCAFFKALSQHPEYGNVNSGVSDILNYGNKF